MKQPMWKVVGAIVFAVIAIALAIWSGMRSFAPKGKAVGNLGYLGGEREEAVKGGASRPQPLTPPR